MDELLRQISEDRATIDTLDADSLEKVRAAIAQLAVDTGKAIEEGTDPDPDEAIRVLEDANSMVDAIDARLETLAAEKTERAERVAALTSRFHVEPDEETDEEPVEEVETPTVDTDSEPEAAEDSAEIEEPVEEVAVAASAPTLGAIAKRVPKDRQPQPARHVLRDAKTGAELTVAGFGEAMAAMQESTRRTSPKTTEFHSVARFDVPAHKYTLKGSDVEWNGQQLDLLRKELAGGADALVASGGICAPAQPIYDFFSISTEDGLLQLPTLGAPRGAVTYPVSPSFDTIWTTANWRNAVGGNPHTNAEDIAGATKNVYAPACPDTATCTVAAYPAILQFGNFADLFYPEFVAHVSAESMRAHAHLVNQAHITNVVAAATVVGGGNPGGGTLVNLAQILGFEAAKYREKYRMSREATLDAVLPHWIIDAAAADIVARDSTTSLDNARARVRALFPSLNLSAQFVYDWQGISDGAFGGFPATVDVLMFAPGTVVRLDGGSLNLGVVRDSVLNSTNDFQTFVETFEAICVPGHEVLLINDVAVCPTGATGQRASITCVVGS